MNAASNKFTHKAFLIAIGIVVVAVVLAISVQFSMERSEAFSAAETFLRSSKELQQLIGIVNKVSLSSSGESFVNEAGNDGNAKLSLAIVGRNETADAEVNLARRLRTWHVASASVKVQGEAKVVSLPIEQAAR